MLTFRHQSRFSFYGGILREKAVGHPRGLTGGLCLAGPWFRSRQLRDGHIQGKAFVLLWTLLYLGSCHVWRLCPTQKWPGSTVNGAAFKALLDCKGHFLSTTAAAPTDTFMHLNAQPRCVCVCVCVRVHVHVNVLGVVQFAFVRVLPPPFYLMKEQLWCPFECMCVWVSVRGSLTSAVFLENVTCKFFIPPVHLCSNNAINHVQDKVMHRFHS